MKHYLLTWYGMADLSAALGLTGSDGPVLSAVKTGRYTDVVILGYTNADKPADGFTGQIRDEWDQWIAAPMGERAELTPMQRDRIKDAASNTAAGHEVFASWLTEQVRDAGETVTIQMLPQKMTSLHDAEGIYAAAVAAVQVPLDDPDMSAVTVYISPGTPVMAYTWALLARSNPSLDLQVLASSDVKKPPQPVIIPKRLLATPVARPREGDPAVPEGQSYDLVIHLVGEQPMPALFGMRQFPASKTKFLTTEAYKDTTKWLAQAVGIPHEPIVVSDPFDQEKTRAAIAHEVAKLPAGSTVAVNTTGGTKLMFNGAMAACWELGLEPFYIEIGHHHVIMLRDGSHVPFVGLNDVEGFLRAGGYPTVHAGRWPTSDTSPKNQRKDAAATMWKHRSALRSLYKSKGFTAAQDTVKRWKRPTKPNSTGPKARDHLGLKATSDRVSFEITQGTKGTGTVTFHAPKGEDTVVQLPRQGFFTFLSGGWLEEYVYWLLRPLQDDGLIHDLRVGFIAGFKDPDGGQHDNMAGEFDVTFTDGKRLWIVECKAGAANQIAVQKLVNNVRTFGGVGGRGILISGAAEGSTAKPTTKRLNDSDTVTGVLGPETTTETLRKVIEAQQ